MSTPSTPPEYLVTAAQECVEEEEWSDEEGNTSSLPPHLKTKSTFYWFVTWFPYGDQKCAESAALNSLLNDAIEAAKLFRNCVWAVGQFELTEDKRAHIHLSLGFSRSERMAVKLSKAFKGCKIQVTRNWRWSQTYCCKTRTRIPGTEPRFWNVDPSLRDTHPARGGTEGKYGGEIKRNLKGDKAFVETWKQTGGASAKRPGESNSTYLERRRIELEGTSPYNLPPVEEMMARHAESFVRLRHGWNLDGTLIRSADGGDGAMEELPLPSGVSEIAREFPKK